MAPLFILPFIKKFSVHLHFIRPDARLGDLPLDAESPNVLQVCAISADARIGTSTPDSGG